MPEPVGSPRWWLDRLLRRLTAQQFDLDRLDSYYEGRHPLSFMDTAVRDKFGNRFHRFSANFTALVVDGIAERLRVDGFRFRDETGDDDLWAIWQENDMDGSSLMAHTEALIKRTAYALVEPQTNQRTPRITIEDPLNCIVELDPRDRRKRRAALKRWIDDDGHLVLYVYLPTTIHTYRSTAVWQQPSDALSVVDPYSRMFDDYRMPGTSGLLENPIPNTLGVVPVVPITNRPRPRYPLGVSEIEYISSNQDAINYYRVLATIGGRNLAYAQRYAINLPIEVDETTGQPKKPFKGGLADIWQIEPYDPDDPRASMDASKVELGQFPASDMQPFINLIKWEVGAMASISRMPYHDLLGEPQSIPASAEANKTGEAGLLAKVATISTFMGEGWEETMRLALLAMKDERADIRTSETRWADTATRNEAVRTDSVVKQFSPGLIDDELALEQLGYTQTQIRRLRERRAQAAQQGAQGAEGAGPEVEVIPAPTGPRMTATEAG